MSLANLTVWPNVVISVIVAVVLLYLARVPAHYAIKSFSRVIYNAMRMTARSLMIAEKRLTRRNREVLLASGMEHIEKEIEREFYRVNSVVQRDLQGYPALHRSMADLITKIDEDYRESTEVPPSPPGWINAVESVAKIPTTGDAMVSNILKDIHKTLTNHHNHAMDEYRKSSGQRHSLLKKMMPFWRKLTNTVDEVGKTITGLIERSKVIDNRMAEYEAIRAGADNAVRKLSSSSMTQFVISGLVMMIAVAGAMINFNLIALPMSEMVGGGSYIGNFKASNVAALVIILVESAMGIYLMESLRITRLFPIIGTMDDKLRRKMIWVSFTILFILASVEAALAFMRDLIAADMQALRQSLAGVENVEAAHRWIPTVGQMIMGFVLPFALAFVAIPLESFVHSSRTVMGVALTGLIRGVALLFRLIGNITMYLGQGLVNIYDLFIFPALWIERLVRGKPQQTKTGQKKEVT